MIKRLRGIVTRVLVTLFILTSVPGIFASPLSAEAGDARDVGETTEALNVSGAPSIESLVRNRFDSESSEETFLSETAVQRIEAIPEILIESEDAQAANEELAQLETTIQQFLDERRESPEMGWAFSFSYSATTRDDLFSLCFRVEGMEPSETFQMGPYIYNFDLATGQRLNDSAFLAKYLGVPEDASLLSRVLKANIVRNAAEACAEDQDYIDASEKTVKGDEEQGVFPDYLRGKILVAPLAYAAENSVTSLEHALNEPEASRLFLNSIDGEEFLTMVYVQYLDSRSEAIMIEKPVLLFPDERSLNPVFVKLLEAVGQDASGSPGVEVLVAHLGAAYEQETIDEMSAKVEDLRGQLDETTSPMPLLALDVDEEGRVVASLDQVFLIVPRYQEDAIEFAKAEISEVGTIRPLDEDLEAVETWHQYGKGWGLMGIMAETFPTGLVRVSNLSRVGAWWAPAISGMDGSVIVPDHVLNITDDVATLLADGAGGATDSDIRDLFYALMPWVE